MIESFEYIAWGCWILASIWVIVQMIKDEPEHFVVNIMFDVDYITKHWRKLFIPTVIFLVGVLFSYLHWKHSTDGWP